MNQKKLIPSFIFASVIATSVWAQKGDFSLLADIGYGFPSGEQSIQNWTSTTPSIIPYSLGQGINIDCNGNYMLNPVYGAGLDLNFLFGTPTSYSTTAIAQKGTTRITYSYTGYMFSVTPNFVLTVPNTRFNPYGKFGVVLGFAEYTWTSTEKGYEAFSGKDVWLYSGNDPSIGWYAAFGLYIPLGHQKLLNIEIFDRDLSYAPGMESNIEAPNGGKTNSTSIPLVYSKSPNSASNIQLTSVMPFGSVGIKVGMTWDCGALKFER